MAKFPTYEEMAKEVAEKALDEYIYKGKTLREWIEILSQTRWIPASERLPEEGVDVLACFYTGEGNYKMMVSRRSDYNYWGGVGRTSDMVAWMPLPEPYNAD